MVDEGTRPVVQKEKRDLYSRLSRVTSSGRFIPEVDGLRFLAISSVLLYHTYTFYSVKSGITGSVHTIWSSIWMVLCKNGFVGVYLFFAISGFILGLPFAQCYIEKQSVISLKSYFLRRLTRLEPPYVLSMLLFFALLVGVGKYTPGILFPHLLSSIFYLHNLIYQAPSIINGVAWSLEIEVQFYLLAPLFGLVFRIPSFFERSVIWIVSILFFSCLSFFYDPEIQNFKTLIGYFQYFLAGLFLADLHIFNFIFPNIKKINFFIFIFGFLSLLFLLFADINSVIWIRLMYPFVILVFYYLVLKTTFWKNIFSIKPLTVVGGMCYSIYLLHYIIISMVGNITIHYLWEDYFWLNYWIQIIIYLVFILTISTFFFLMIEKPTMNKDWYKEWIPKKLN